MNVLRSPGIDSLTGKLHKLYFCLKKNFELKLGKVCSKTIFKVKSWFYLIIFFLSRKPCGGL